LLSRFQSPESEEPSVDALGPFLLVDKPEVYNLPPDPVVPTQKAGQASRPCPALPLGGGDRRGGQRRAQQTGCGATRPRPARKARKHEARRRHRPRRLPERAGEAFPQRLGDLLDLAGLALDRGHGGEVRRQGLRARSPGHLPAAA
jgi:hypothetical protein